MFFSEITVILKNKPPAIGNFSDCGLSYFCAVRKKHSTPQKNILFLNR